MATILFNPIGPPFDFSLSAGGGSGSVNSLTGNDHVVVNPSGNNINVIGLGVSGSGVSSAGNIFTTGNGSTLTVNETQAQFLQNYTNANTNLTANVYTATPTDYYISGDTSATGANAPISIRLPNSPGTNRMFIIKDRGGDASTNNIAVTTVSGVVLIDGATTYELNIEYESIELVFNGSSYEVF